MHGTLASPPFYGEWSPETPRTAGPRYLFSTTYRSVPRIVQRWDELAPILPSYPSLSTVRASSEANGDSGQKTSWLAMFLAFR